VVIDNKYRRQKTEDSMMQDSRCMMHDPRCIMHAARYMIHVQKWDNQLIRRDKVYGGMVEV
jgi:hypothetical protein